MMRQHGCLLDYNVHLELPVKGRDGWEPWICPQEKRLKKFTHLLFVSFRLGVKMDTALIVSS